MSYRKSLSILLLTLTPASAFGQEKSLPPEHIEFFEKNIRPALVKYCYECHSVEENTSRGGLLLDTRSNVLLGGDSGPALEPGDVAGSLIWEAINYLDKDIEMPPDEKMPSEVIANFRKWIEMGAPDPR